MSVQIFKDYNALSKEAADKIIALIKNKPNAVLCLASGDTPRLAYTLLAEKAKKEKIDFSQCSFIGLDEWIGIPPDNAGSCSFFLNSLLFKPLAISPSQIRMFDGLSKDLASECSKMDRIIREKGGIDLMLVGVGMNGHIGFNEPGVSMDLYAHVVDLDATTQSVGQKYFTQSTALQQGITLGLKHFLESRMVILMASGTRKAEVILSALEGPVTMSLPASTIRKHPDSFVMLDADAARLLDRKDQPGDL